MSIYFNESTRTFYLEGKNTSYVFFINKRGFAEHLYFGKRIGRDDLFYTLGEGGRSAIASVPGCDDVPGIRSYYQCPAEISFFGTGDFREPTVEVINPDGDRLTELLYDSHEILKNKPKISGMPSLDGGETLVLHLIDNVTGFAADLYYTVYDDSPVIARRIVYKNKSRNTIRLNRAYSFAITIPSLDYDVLSLYGAWCKERVEQRIPAHHGVISIDSKRTSSSATLNPFIALVEKGANENFGNVYGFNLVYSSSYVLKAEGKSDGTLHITGGINDFDFSWKLEPDEILEAPEVVIAYSSEGVGGMSRAYHDVYREHLISKRFVKAPRPVVINNWEATSFNFTGDQLREIAKSVVDTGIDTFVMDDGWFGKRDDAYSGLGDWYVNEKKLGSSLRSLVDYIHSLGFKFGIWFEPEMINEDSDLFRAHPDYAIGAPNRPHCYGRHQFVLDITRKDVRDYIVDAINKVIRENNVDYVKWDYNRNVTESYSVLLPPDRQSEFAHRYALGLYDLCERIVEANPTVFFEGCASGGARFDPGMLKYFPQIWTSDNSDADERTIIQHGTSIVYPLSSISCHVSKYPSKMCARPVPMKTRGDIAQMGPTGYELDTTKMSPEDFAEIKPQIEEYRRCESLILEGDLFRLDNPIKTNYFSYMIVSKDKSFATLTVYQRIGRRGEAIKRVVCKGLDPDKRYFVPELEKTLSGSTLMSVGIVPTFNYENNPTADFRTAKYHIIEK